VKIFVTACLFAGLSVFPAKADIIYFKDGMKTICQEAAWEEDGAIKCEYAGWVISYQKSDVLRILKTTRTKQTPAPEKTATADKTAPAIKTVQPENKPPVTQTAVKGSVPEKIKTVPGQAAGPVFYDPRRPYKYWADKDSKHKGYKQAIAALAKKYNCTPEWIQAHMGDTNDLAQIHHNLSKPQPIQTVKKALPGADQAPEVLFYNPRRPYPYRTGEKSKHKSYKEAIQTLAKKYDRSPEWIKLNMGVTNDLNEIHKNLAERKAADPS
jgi:hypothetical protein